MTKLRVAFCQLNPTVGDIKGNRDKILSCRNSANSDVDLLVFPEMFLTGYPIEDLVMRPNFIKEVLSAIEYIKKVVATDSGPSLLFGAPIAAENIPNLNKPSNFGKSANCAVFVGNNTINENDRFWLRCKSELPNFDVFDEKRQFIQGSPDDNLPFVLNGFEIGVAICEDLWWERVANSLDRNGAKLLITMHGSPYQAGSIYQPDKNKLRKEVIAARISECPNIPMVYLNMVGGQDDIIFDGASFVMDRHGEMIFQAKAFEEDIIIVDFHKDAGNNINLEIVNHTQSFPYPDNIESIYRGLMLSIRDYVEKNGFPGVLTGASGGIDSSLSLTIATDALGPDKVWALRMPSRYTSDDSMVFAADLAKRLGIRCNTVSIAGMFDEIQAGIGLMENEPTFNLPIKNETLWLENSQARERAEVLMALSNKYGHLVLANSNKSEASVGYATVGGDTMAGYTPLLNVYKMTVYALAAWRNQNYPVGSRMPAGSLNVIPETIISRPPTAELRPGQVDTESLPPYPILDFILENMIELEVSSERIVSRLLKHFTSVEEDQAIAMVNQVRRLVDISEYKRRLTPIGSKIQPKSFGKGRRYPITNWFREIYR